MPWYPAGIPRRYHGIFSGSPKAVFSVRMGKESNKEQALVFAREMEVY